MAQIAIQGKKFYFTDAGVPLAGGKIYYYEAGTDTLKDTYTSSAGTTPNSNPVVLDSAGRATIFFGSGSYKEVVKDSSDNLISTVDGISSTGGDSTTAVETYSELRALTAGVSDLVVVSGGSAAGDGAGGIFRWDSTNTDADDGGVTIKPSTNPTSGRWVRNIEQGFVNVDWYVPTGDGVVDDTAKFTSAYTYAYNNNLYVLLPDGTFLWTSAPTHDGDVWTVFTPDAILKWSSIQPALKVHIYDKEQHFDISSGSSEAPVLGGVDYIFPEWFGETLASHAIATEVVDANQNGGYLHTTLAYTQNLVADTDDSDIVTTIYDSAETKQATVTQTTDFELATVNGKITLDSATTIELEGATNITGNTTVTGTCGITGNSTITGTFGVTGNTTITGSLDTTSVVDVNYGGECLRIGADSGATTRTNATNKFARITAPHYLTAEENTLLLEAENSSTANVVTIGGRDGSFNAATDVYIAAAANNTTLTGTNIARFDSDGVELLSGNVLLPTPATIGNATQAAAITINGAAVTAYGNFATTNGNITSNGGYVGADKGLQVTEGSNAYMGAATLSGGAVTVNTTAVTANSRIFLSIQSLDTVATPMAIGVTARVAGTSFTITSEDGTDTSVIAWMIVEPL